MRFASASASALLVTALALSPGACDAAWSPFPSFARRKTVTVTALPAAAGVSSNETAALEQMNAYANWAQAPQQEGNDDTPTTSQNLGPPPTIPAETTTITPASSKLRQETISRALLETRLARERAERERRQLPAPTPRDLINQAMKEKQQTKQAPAAVENASPTTAAVDRTVPKKERFVVPQIQSKMIQTETFSEPQGVPTPPARVTQSTPPTTNPLGATTNPEPMDGDKPKPVVETKVAASKTEGKVIPAVVLPEAEPMPNAFSSSKPEPTVVAASTTPTPSKDTTVAPPKKPVKKETIPTVGVATMSESAPKAFAPVDKPKPTPLEPKEKIATPPPPVIQLKSVVVAPSEPPLPADKSPTLVVGDKTPVQAAAVLVDKGLDQVDSSVVGGSGTVADAAPVMVDIQVEVAPQPTTIAEPTPSKKVDMSDLADKLPKIEMPKMEMPKIDIPPEAVEQATKLAKMTAQALVQGATFAFKEGYELALRTKNSLNTTMVEEMDITYEEALTKVSRGIRGFVMICVVLGGLVKDAATGLAEEVKAANARRQAEAQAGVNSWEMDEMKTKAGSVFGDLVASASTALDQVKAQVLKDSMDEFQMPSVSTVTKQEAAAEAFVEMDTPEDGGDDDKVKVPFFLNVD